MFDHFKTFLNDAFVSGVDCTDLNVPINGALACDTWIHGISCAISCGDGWDIARSAPDNGRYTCSDTSGEWIPHDIIPDCTCTLVQCDDVILCQ